MREGDSEAHLIQVFYEPDKIIALEVRYTPQILVSVKYITELVLKV